MGGANFPSGLRTRFRASPLSHRSNILGHKGEVVEEFAVIIQSLWAGQYKYISPRDFKNTIGKINEQFSGYDQQDSQELLLFLMDGLHEDLNKVRPGPGLVFPQSRRSKGT